MRWGRLRGGFLSLRACCASVLGDTHSCVKGGSRAGQPGGWLWAPQVLRTILPCDQSGAALVPVPFNRRVLNGGVSNARRGYCQGGGWGPRGGRAVPPASWYLLRRARSRPVAFSCPSPSLIWRLGLPPSAELMQTGRALGRGALDPCWQPAPAPAAPGRKPPTCLGKRRAQLLLTGEPSRAGSPRASWRNP